MVVIGKDWNYMSSDHKYIEVSSRDVFLKSVRYDLIFKFLYLKNIDTSIANFHKANYLESIRYFNNYYEETPLKLNGEDFIRHFNSTYNSIVENGFDCKISNVVLTKGGDLWDGAHRLSISAFLDLKIQVEMVDKSVEYDYKFFKNKGMPQWLLDYGALEFVKHSKYAFVATVHSCVNKKFDLQIQDLINSNCKIYYGKEILLNSVGYINLKKISYQGCGWIGSIDDSYMGAVRHAELSSGDWPIRAYVIISDSLNDIIAIKFSIRNLVGKGNYSVHITDNHEESVTLASVLFSPPTLRFINCCPVETDFTRGDHLIMQYINLLNKYKFNKDDYCVVGSYTMTLLGIRCAKDLDYIAINRFQSVCGKQVDLHASENDFHVSGEAMVICDPRMHFYFLGIKFYTPEMLIAYKSRRLEVPKDVEDILLMSDFINGVSIPFKYGSIEERRVKINALNYIKLKFKRLINIVKKYI